MNYLAHIFLSGSDRRMQIGNFIGDAVKGNSYNGYPDAIRNGILLHRAIDSYTDNHPRVKEAIKELKPSFGRYSGIVLDMYFDYLLGSHFPEFSGIPLKRFTRRFYRALIHNRRRLPLRIRRFMWHFIFTGRLGRYATKQGLHESLEIMIRYKFMDISADRAILYLSENEEKLLDTFRLFMAEIMAYCDDYIRTLKNN